GGVGEEVRILAAELVFTFPRKLWTSSEVPSNFNDWNAALLQPLDLSVYNFHGLLTKWSLSSIWISSNGITSDSSDKYFFRLDM
ncbi:hypothetical protein Tco_1307541, partial [Tanacetum coccineum]